MNVFKECKWPTQFSAKFWEFFVINIGILQSYCQLAINARSLAQRFEEPNFIRVKSSGVS